MKNLKAHPYSHNQNHYIPEGSGSVRKSLQAPSADHSQRTKQNKIETIPHKNQYYQEHHLLAIIVPVRSKAFAVYI